MVNEQQQTHNPWPTPAGLSGRKAGKLADELLHLPDKPAGVGKKGVRDSLADELFHLPDKLAGVIKIKGKILAECNPQLC